jgi:hypothetical protein
MPRLITFSDWMRKMRDELWPSGYPENCINSIRGYFVAGCMDMQRTIECLQENNASIFPACATFFNGGLTFVNAPGPKAVIRRVWTTANGDWNNKVFYRQHEYADLAEWSLNLLEYAPPLNVGLPKLPMGDRYTEKVTDSKLGRSRTGIWALNRRRIYLAPWIQSNETVVIEWDGTRVDWKDTDLIDLDVWCPLHEEALKLYVKGEYEFNFGTMSESLKIKDTFADRLALLINDCTTETTRRNEQGVPHAYTASSAELTSEKVPAEETVPALAIIGAYGSGDNTEVKLATLVNSWSPVAIITNGGNNLGDITDIAEWDRRVGKYFQAFMFPYVGSYGAGAESNAFWPAMDYGERTSASVFAEYFQSVGTQKRYDVVVGNVHFFVLNGDTDYTEQLTWLQSALALSTARWKVVVVNSLAALDQDFSEWGVDATIYGRQETYSRTDSTIVFGDPSTPIALKLSASCTSLKISAFSADGTTTDTLEVT